MKQLDEQLEQAPTEAAVKELAELRIRNLQAFAELQSYNDTGKFLCEHPLLSGRSEFSELVRLLQRDPSEFLRRHKNVLDNIRRYESFLKRKDRKAQRQQDREHLARHRHREELFRMVLEQEHKTS